jgi:probable F420-dependent oxidoreductase
MKIGINNISMKADEMVAGAVLAEELGYDSVWYGEHIVLPRHVKTKAQPSLYGPQEFLDAFVLLAGLACATSRIRLATGILTLPFRAPIMAARQILGVDILSKGRFDFVIGLGWCQEEFDAAGTDKRTRGARTDEAMDLINQFFQPGDTAFEGKHYRIDQTAFDPKPVQKPRPPFIVGGHTEAALRRAARWDGWYGVVDSVEEFKVNRDRIEGYRREYGRENEPFDYSLGLHQGMSHGGSPSRELLEAYSAAGVHRLVVTPWGYDYHRALDRTAEYARQIGLRG